MTLQEALDNRMTARNAWSRALDALGRNNKRGRKLHARGLKAGHPDVEAWIAQSRKLRAQEQSAYEDANEAFRIWYTHPMNTAA